MTERLHILIAEDDEDHALLTELAIRAAQPELAARLDVATVAHGREALAYLHASRTLPDLMLLDLKMPDVGGLEVLRAMRADAALRSVPVIVVSTSARDQDVGEALRLGANDYIAKPLKAEVFRAKIQAIPAYWSRVVGPGEPGQRWP